MRAWLCALSAIPLFCVNDAPRAGAPALSTPNEPLHVAIQALADQQGIKAGQTFRVALIERIEPGWHTYWINPGDAGQATKLHWALPDGYRIDDVQWPVPQVFRSGPVVSYGYEGEVVLRQTVHAPSSLSASPAQLSVEAQWLACEDICIPKHAEAQVTVRQVSSAAIPARSVSAALFANASERLLRPSPWGTSPEVGAVNVVLTLTGIARSLPSAATLQFLPLTWGEIDNAALQTSTRSERRLAIRGDT